MKTRPSGWDQQVETGEGLRRALLKFIADFANWDNSANLEYLETGRALVRAAHPEETPLVVDPFAGGGSIPLEALRLGCEAFASDLNPVACLILKVMLEDIPRHGPGLAKELRKAGAEIKAKAEKELADLYPKDPDGATPIAYLWARTVRCESPELRRGDSPDALSSGCAGSPNVSGRCAPMCCGMMAFRLGWSLRYSSRSPKERWTRELWHALERPASAAEPCFHLIGYVPSLPHRRAARTRCSTSMATVLAALG